MLDSEHRMAGMRCFLGFKSPEFEGLGGMEWDHLNEERNELEGSFT